MKGNHTPEMMWHSHDGGKTYHRHKGSNMSHNCCEGHPDNHNTDIDIMESDLVNQYRFGGR